MINGRYSQWITVDKVSGIAHRRASRRDALTYFFARCERESKVAPISEKVTRCECFDADCPSACHIKREVARMVLYRVDMFDPKGLQFCEACAEDALDSGLFSVGGEDEE